MKTYELKIEGAAPMLMNRLSRELNIEIKKIPKDKKDEWEDANWQKKLYTKEVDGKTEIIIPDLVLHSFLINACKKYKVSPPTSIGKTWTDYFRSSVIVPECAIVKNVTVVPYGTMVNGNPSSMKKSSKVYRVRPMIKKGWTATIVLIDLQDYLKKEIVEEIVDCGGKYVGLCDWRPLHGRFIVRGINVNEGEM